MTTAKELHNVCNEIRNQRREEVKVVLTEWLESFIFEHRRWRAVIGNRRCKPIPIHRDFSQSEYKPSFFFSWPDLPHEEIQEVIQSLGFVVTGKEAFRFCLSVPPCEKGKPLTFAQEWVKKINYSYSVYISHARKKAEFFYHVILSELCEMPVSNIKTCFGYTLFKDYKFETKIHSQYVRHRIDVLLAKDGIKPYYDVYGAYKGLCVLQQ